MTVPMEPIEINEGGTLMPSDEGTTKTGFPSPADDIRERLDLVDLLVRHKASTFFFRVGEVAVSDSGMEDGDILIVDRAIDPYNGCKAVCFIDGEYTVKSLEIDRTKRPFACFPPAGKAPTINLLRFLMETGSWSGEW